MMLSSWANNVTECTLVVSIMSSVSKVYVNMLPKCKDRSVWLLNRNSDDDGDDNNDDDDEGKQLEARQVQNIVVIKSSRSLLSKSPLLAAYSTMAL